MPLNLLYCWVKLKPYFYASLKNNLNFLFFSNKKTRLKKEEELLGTHSFRKLTNTNSKSQTSTTKPPKPKIEIKTEPRSSLSLLNNLNQTKCYGKSNVSGEDIENFVTALALMNNNDSKKLNKTEPSSSNTTHMDHDYIQSRSTNIKYNEDPNSMNGFYTEDTDTRSSFTTSRCDATEMGDEDTNDFDDDRPRKNTARKNNKLKKQKKVPVAKKTPMQPKRRTQRNSSSINTNNELDDSMSNKRAKKTGNNKKESLVKQQQAPMQCLGPGCVNAVKQDDDKNNNSKYCSNECGMKLAKTRLCLFLKSRYDEFNKTPCLADQINLRELERINSEIDIMKKKLSELEIKHVDLDRLIERAKDKKINPNIDKEYNESMSSSDSAHEIHCVSCGIMCSEKQALKHMEKCFNKVCFFLIPKNVSFILLSPEANTKI
jgi:hypothetical protein